MEFSEARVCVLLQLIKYKQIMRTQLSCIKPAINEIAKCKQYLLVIFYLGRQLFFIGNMLSMLTCNSFIIVPFT